MNPSRGARTARRWAGAVAGLLVLGVLPAFSATPPPPAARRAPELGSVWNGTFSYPENGRPVTTPFHMTFQNVSVSEDASIFTVTGTISEPRTDFGPPGDTTLYSTFTGRWQGGNPVSTISFTKTYAYDGHKVEYYGTYNENSGTISGTWRIDDYSGGFTLAGVRLRDIP